MNQAGRAYWMSGSRSARQQKGVLVADGPGVEEAPGVLQAADDLAVGVLDPAALEPGDVGGETAVGGPPRRGAEFRRRCRRRRPSSGAVRGPPRRRAGASWTRPVPWSRSTKSAARDAPEGRDRGAAREAALEAVVPLPVVVERRAVAAADQRVPPEGAEHRERAAEAGGERRAEGAGDHQPARRAAGRLVGDLFVVAVGADGGVEVRGEGPGSGGPDDERKTGVVQQGERHMDRGVLDLAVAEADLRRRKGGAALGPPPDDLLAAVEEALPLQLGQRPPDAFDVGAAVGHIGVFEVHPVADAVGHLLPVADVAEDARLALLDETADAELLDPGAAADPELLFDLHLDRQPVGVPAGDPLHPTPAHGPVAREDVLEDAGQDMPVVGPPVRGRGGRRATPRAPPRRAGATLLAKIRRSFQNRPISASPAAISETGRAGRKRDTQRWVVAPELRRRIPWRPQRDSNPCFRRERATSWATRRWGPEGVGRAGIEPATSRLKGERSAN